MSYAIRSRFEVGRRNENILTGGCQGNDSRWHKTQNEIMGNSHSQFISQRSGEMRSFLTSDYAAMYAEYYFTFGVEILWFDAKLDLYCSRLGADVMLIQGIMLRLCHSVSRFGRVFKVLLKPLEALESFECSICNENISKCI